jgi:hypothetical protein
MLQTIPVTGDFQMYLVELLSIVHEYCLHNNLAFCLPAEA